MRATKVATLITLIALVSFSYLAKESFAQFRLPDFASIKANPSAPKPQIVPYSLQWQNQKGQPFSGCLTCPNYLWLNIDITLISYSNFTQNSNITMYAFGTMSKYLVNSSLASITVTYDGAVPYLPNQIGYTGAYGLILDVVPNGTVPMDYAFGPTVSLLARPIYITWRFAGGPHYPTLDIHYWSGQEITQEFRNAPVMIQLPQPPIPTETRTVTTTSQTQTTTSSITQTTTSSTTVVSVSNQTVIVQPPTTYIQSTTQSQPPFWIPNFIPTSWYPWVAGTLVVLGIIYVVLREIRGWVIDIFGSWMGLLEFIIDKEERKRKIESVKLALSRRHRKQVEPEKRDGKS